MALVLLWCVLSVDKFAAISSVQTQVTLDWIYLPNLTRLLHHPLVPQCWRFCRHEGMKYVTPIHYLLHSAPTVLQLGSTRLRQFKLLFLQVSRLVSYDTMAPCSMDCPNNHRLSCDTMAPCYTHLKRQHFHAEHSLMVALQDIGHISSTILM